MRGVGLGDFCAEDVRKRKKAEGRIKNTAILNSKLKIGAGVVRGGRVKCCPAVCADWMRCGAASNIVSVFL